MKQYNIFWFHIIHFVRLFTFHSMRSWGNNYKGNNLFYRTWGKVMVNGVVCGFQSARESVKVFATQIDPTPCNLTDCSLPVSSVHGILQTRILEWVAILFSRGSSQPRDRTWVSHIAGRFFIIWAIRETHSLLERNPITHIVYAHWFILTYSHLESKERLKRHKKNITICATLANSIPGIPYPFFSEEA